MKIGKQLELEFPMSEMIVTNRRDGVKVTYPTPCGFSGLTLTLDEWRELFRLVEEAAKTEII